MAMSSIVKAALSGLQYLAAKTINVVGNKADIVFTRLDTENDLRKIDVAVRSAIEGATNILDNEDLKHIVMPVVPSELPAIEMAYNHETFTTINGDISLMGSPGLIKVTLDNYLLPSNPFKYSFCRPYGSSAQQVINFITEAQIKYIPLRVTIAYHSGQTYLNMPCLVESFSYSRDGVDDMRLTVNLIEYIVLGDKITRPEVK